MKKVISILLTIGIGFLLVGCSVNDNKPEEAVETFFEKYRNHDDNVITQLTETIKNEVMNDENKEKYQQLMEKQYDSLAYVIKDIDENDDEAIATVELTVLDYKSAITEAEEELEKEPAKFNDEEGNYDEDKYMKRKIELMEKVDTTITETINLSLTKDAGMWKVNDLSNDDIKKLHGLY